MTTQQVVVDQPNSDNVVVNFPLYVEEKVEPFLDEKFEVNLLEQTIEIGLKNFQTAEKRKREQEVNLLTLRLFKNKLIFFFYFKINLLRRLRKKSKLEEPL